METGKAGRRHRNNPGCLEKVKEMNNISKFVFENLLFAKLELDWM